MSSRCTRSGLRAVVVLLAALPLAASVGAGAEASTPATTAPPKATLAAAPTLTLLHQSPEVVQPGAGPSGATPFEVELGFGSSVPAGAAVELTLYRKLTSRSQFEQTLQSGPSGDKIDSTSLLRRQLTPGPHGGFVFATEVSASPSACGSSSSLDVACQSGVLPGVYPLVVSVSNGSGGPALGRFTTFLTYAGSNVGQPLKVAVVLPISAPVVLRPKATTAATAIAPPSAGALSTVRGVLDSLAQFPAVPVTLEPSPQTLQGLAGQVTLNNRLAMSTLEQLSSEQRLHQIPAQPYVPVDLGALASAGEGTEVDGQLKRGAAVLRKLGVATTAGSETWVATQPVGPSIAAGLAQVSETLGVSTTHLVVPQGSVALPPTAEDLTWASTFSLSLGRGQPVVAAESDSALSAHFSGAPGDPALAAQQLLADLAVIQSEQPNTPGRGVLAVPPAGWVPSAAFDDELLAGLSANPVASPLTLDGFFGQVVPFAPTSSGEAVHLAGSGTALPAGLPHELTAARLRLTGFDSAVPGEQILTQLDQVLLAAESADLGPSEQRTGVATFNRVLNGQLQLVQIASERTITLTARTGFVPVTVLSSAPYHIHGVLTLTSPKLVSTARMPLILNRSTNSVRMPVEVRTSGDLPVVATFTSPQEGLTITRAQMTIRSTATSLVGIILTVAALAVLLGWWARTVWSGRRRRRAAAAAEREVRV